MNTLLWVVLIGGIYNVFMGLVSNTNNVQSAIVFKVIPFFLGLSSIVYSLQALNIISIIK